MRLLRLARTYIIRRGTIRADGKSVKCQRPLARTEGRNVQVNVTKLTLITVVVPALLFAYPGFGGGKGLFRIQNALVEKEAGLTVSLHALTRNSEFYASEDTPNSSGWIADIIAPELSYAPIALKYIGLELFGSWGGAFQKPESQMADAFVWGFNDLRAGGKFSVLGLPVLKLGGCASYTLIGRENRNPDWVVLDPGGLPYGASSKLNWSGLATLQLQDVLLPLPNVIANYGKVGGMTRYGTAIEFQGRGFCLFVEALSQQSDRVSDGMFDTRHGHIHLTPGIVIGSPTSAFLKVGYTLSIGGESLGVKPPNELVVGFGYATPLGRQARREYGQIAGAVTDATTGSPLAATVTFPDHPELGTLAADRNTGAFKVMKVPAGAVTVEASAEGYESRTVPLMVENHEPATATIALPRVVAAVEVTGRVSDRKTGEALAATILVPEADSAVFKTDPATGIYRARLMPGAYSMIVESKDYLKQNAWLLVEKDKPLARDFQLIAEWMVISLRGVQFDFDRATITPDSRPALQDAARILKDNPTIKVEIQGHTDNKGSDAYNLRLSEKRAQAVVNYLVRNLGIDVSRLTARGYGESRPIADNKTEDGRAINRRVDFAILGQTGHK
jgi:outer membrane protein OmpA-like peptidoglycan-associated protein